MKVPHLLEVLGLVLLLARGAECHRERSARGSSMPDETNRPLNRAGTYEDLAEERLLLWRKRTRIFRGRHDCE